MPNDKRRVTHHIVQHTAALQLAAPEPRHVRAAVFFRGTGEIGSARRRRAARPKELTSGFDLRRENLILEIALSDSNPRHEISHLLCFGDISRQQRIADNDAAYVDPQDMLAELHEDNQRLVASMREAHDTCDEHNDVATTSLLEVYIDETERRAWFLYEAARKGDPSGH